MPLEEGIIEWSRTRPQWQQIVLRAVAEGRALSDEALGELVDAVVAGKRLAGGGLEVGHLLASAPDAPPVSLASVSEPAHVNALSSTVPLTCPEQGVTIVYGDNGSGKSGYARLLKRIARSRASEAVLTDVFRDTPGYEPTAKLRVRIGGEVEELVWPELNRSEVQRMLFYDSACGYTYIADEADFPYRPYALFVMDGLIAACGRIRGLVDAKLDENARSGRSVPQVTEETTDTEVGRFLHGLHRGSSLGQLDALLAELDDPGMSLDTVHAEEDALRSSDTVQAGRKLRRTAERLDAVADHIELVDSVLGAKAIQELHEATHAVRQLDLAADRHAESLRAEVLPGIGGEPWRVMWDSARRFSEERAYPRPTVPCLRRRQQVRAMPTGAGGIWKQRAHPIGPVRQG